MLGFFKCCTSELFTSGDISETESRGHADLGCILENSKLSELQFTHL